MELAPVLKAIHAVCANGDTLNQIRIFLGDHAVELPIGLDSDVFKPGPTGVRNRLGWTKGEWVLGYVGRLAHIKGVDLLVEAFKQLCRSMPHARLLVVGGGEEERKLRSWLRHELADGIAHLEPDVPHEYLAEWYRAMDLFVMPSRYENYSNALLEALSCGVPFLASDVGGNRVLVDSKGGWLFSASSVDSLAQSLRSIARDPRLARNYGSLGREKVKQTYDWNTTAMRLETIFRSCLSKAGASCKS
jgi:glycosyltransferase involved in cell wall biosynthesis